MKISAYNGKDGQCTNAHSTKNLPLTQYGTYGDLTFYCSKQTLTCHDETTKKCKLGGYFSSGDVDDYEVTIEGKGTKQDSDGNCETKKRVRHNNVLVCKVNDCRIVTDDVSCEHYFEAWKNRGGRQLKWSD